MSAFCGSSRSLLINISVVVFFFSSRRRHTRCLSDWSSDVCSSDLGVHIILLTFYRISDPPSGPFDDLVEGPVDRPDNGHPTAVQGRDRGYQARQRGIIIGHAGLRPSAKTEPQAQGKEQGAYRGTSHDCLLRLLRMT